jgi:hypothetical protein
MVSFDFTISTICDLIIKEKWELYRHIKVG